MKARFLILPLVLAAASLVSAPVLAASGQKARETPAVQPAAYSQPGHVSYEPDGTPIATGAPRRLSILAGNDRRAWTYVHAAKSVAKHKPSHAPR